MSAGHTLRLPVHQQPKNIKHTPNIRYGTPGPRAANNATPTATATFNDSASLAIGIRTTKSTTFCTPGRNPLLSFPATNTRRCIGAGDLYKGILVEIDGYAYFGDGEKT